MQCIVVYLRLFGFTESGLGFRGRFHFLKNVFVFYMTVSTATRMEKIKYLVRKRDVSSGKRKNIVQCTFGSSGLPRVVLGFGASSSF